MIPDQNRSIAVDHSNFQVRQWDFEISMKYGISRGDYEKGLRQHLSGDAWEYMSILNDLGYLGRYGRTIDLLDQLLVYPELNLNYIWIHKNACSFVKAFFMMFYPTQVGSVAEGSIHEHTQLYFTIPFKELLKTLSIIVKRPTVIIIRHPVSRLVSSYVSKFVMPLREGKSFRPYACRIIEQIIQNSKLKGRDPDDSITFREFCSYILTTDIWRVNGHWRPQAWAIPRGGFSKLILMDTESISTLLPEVVRQLNPDVAMPSFDFAEAKRNKSVEVVYKEGHGLKSVLADVLPKDISLPVAHEANNFFDKGLFDKVMKLYEEDMVLYQQVRAAHKANGPMGTGC
ncbi:MAG: sulfotransferase family 2 domain-containing protein [Candidatus Omnitrophica bacterium]|nr:sulfotransferase family 2 domain-containing protein [Candidatus Omnitrophota bacterium]